MQCALCQERDGARFARLLGELRLVEARHEDDPRLGAPLAQASRRFETVDLRHAHVDHGHLGLPRDCELDGRAAVSRGADHRQPVVVVEQQRKRVDEQAMIVDDHHPHRSGLEVSGHARMDLGVFHPLPGMAQDPNT